MSNETLGIGMPIIRIELEGIRQTILHSFGGYTDELNRLVEKEVGKACSSGAVEQIVRAEVSKAMKKIVEDSIRRYFKYGDGRKGLDAAVKDAMTTILDRQTKGDGGGR